MTLGDGDAVVFGGRDGDTLSLTSGSDVVLGDVGQLTFENGIRHTLLGPIESVSYGGDDTVFAGTGDDWIILGAGDDTLTLTSGLNAVLADAGAIVGDTTGLFQRVENTQFSTGGRDTLTGGSGRDLLFGGAGRDVIDGAAGNDYLAGDNALLYRTVLSDGIVEWTFESTAIEVGGDDTLIGGADNDIMTGGFGDDLFDLSIADDLAVGEFLRVRFEQTVATDEEVITSFLTPAVRDLDLLAQVTLGVMGVSKSSGERAEPVSSSLSNVVAMTSRLDIVPSAQLSRPIPLSVPQTVESANDLNLGLTGFSFVTPAEGGDAEAFETMPEAEQTPPVSGEGDTPAEPMPEASTDAASEEPSDDSGDADPGETSGSDDNENAEPVTDNEVPSIEVADNGWFLVGWKIKGSDAA